MLQSGTERGDDELMALLAHGHKEALGALYERHGALVGTVICRLLPAIALPDVTDLSHEVFISLYESARRYQPRGLFQAFLLGIAARKARGHRRSVAIHRRLLERFFGESTASRTQRPEHAVAALDARRELTRALMQLSADHREVVTLFHVQGLSAAEIASCLGISEKTVWTRLHRARRALQQARDGERREAS